MLGDESGTDFSVAPGVAVSWMTRTLVRAWTQPATTLR